MHRFEIYEGILLSYDGPGGHVIVPEGVEYVGTDAFANATSTLTAVTLPHSLQQVGNSAFHGCDRLQTVNLPPTVKMIRAQAFHGCTALEAIDIPDSVEEIGWGAFQECTALKDIKLPAALRKICFLTFAQCTSLQTVVIPPGVSEIERHVFFDCRSLKTVVGCEGVTTIGKRMFEGCVSLREIAVPDAQRQLFWEQWDAAFKGGYIIQRMKADLPLNETEQQWLERSARVILKEIIATDDGELLMLLLARKKRLTAEILDHWIAQCGDAVGLRAMLMAYKHERFAPAQPDRQFAIDWEG